MKFKIVKKKPRKIIKLANFPVKTFKIKPKSKKLPPRGAPISDPGFDMLMGALSSDADLPPSVLANRKKIKLTTFYD